MSAESLNVFLDGTYIGEIQQSATGTLVFSYDEEYRRRIDATPLSLSMPVSRAVHPRRVVLPFL